MYKASSIRLTQIQPIVTPNRYIVTPDQNNVIPGLTRNPFSLSSLTGKKWTPGQARGDEANSPG